MSRIAPARADIAVVGAGFSGLAFARAWQEGGGAAAGSLALIGDDASFGCGLAYGRAATGARLNTLAERMGLSASAPAEFADWLGLQGEARVGYAGREAYGAYLRASLERLSALAGERLLCVRQRVVDLRRQGAGFRLRLQEGSECLARRVVLAVGLPPAAPLPQVAHDLVESGRVMVDPWQAQAMAAIDPEAVVLILGSGLSMVDAVLQLQCQGHRGTVLTLSRRGLLPVRHADHRSLETGPTVAEPIRASSLRGLLAELRHAANAGQDWRARIDALRPKLASFWAGLPVVERSRFLRHARPYWEAHRHRMPPDIADAIADLIDSGQLQPMAGRLLSLREQRGRLALSFKRRGSTRVETLHVDWAIQATGAETDLMRSSDPLLASLLERGLAAADPLRWGLRTSAQLEILAANGETVPDFYCLGALARPALGELVAVPELRRAAASLAQRLLAEE